MTGQLNFGNYRQQINSPWQENSLNFGYDRFTNAEVMPETSDWMRNLGAPKTVETPPSAGAWSREGAFGKGGWFTPTMQGLGAAAGIGLGVLNYREAKNVRQQQQKQFEMNFNMQSNMLEERIRDRHASRERMGGTNRHTSADDAVNQAFKR